MESKAMDDPDPLKIFSAAGGIASFAGLAALLRSGRPLNYRSVATAVLNSGILGLAMAMLWFTYWRDNIYFLVGLCALAGLGGVNMVEFALAVLKAVISKRVGGSDESKD